MERKILANDGLHGEGVRMLREAGFSVDLTKKDTAGLLETINQYDALLVRSATQVTGDILKAGASGKLEFVGRAGVGYDNVDVAAASEHGIVVKIAPHGNTNAAAELALGLMFAVTRNIPQAHATLASGTWLKKPYVGNELSQGTLGLYGCGRIGQRLSALVGGLGMHVIGYDAHLDAVKQLFPDSSISYVSRDELLKNADILSLHAGGAEILIGTSEFALMKPTAYLINTSRGSNVDHDALYDALTHNRLAGAGLDVHRDEPSKDGALFDSRLAALEHVVLTPHLGASTRQAEWKTSVEMATVTLGYFQKGDFTNAFNAHAAVEEELKPLHPIFIHHHDVPGAFGQISSVLATYGFNIRDNPSRTLGDNGFVKTVYLVHQRPTDEVLSALNNLPMVKRATF
ncbi:ACT domain-containing protein [Candidatus Woesearchaeota archaeon]|nr:ACT domain-containing protein [Candidatus Woesearchaeota archaeon]